MNAPLSFPVQIPDAAAVAHIAPELEDDERQCLRERAKKLLREHDAVLVAHYYTDPDLQMLADDTGVIPRTARDIPIPRAALIPYWAQYPPPTNMAGSAANCIN